MSVATLLQLGAASVPLRPESWVYDQEPCCTAARALQVLRLHIGAVPLKEPGCDVAQHVRERSPSVWVKHVAHVVVMEVPQLDVVPLP